ncbi:arsenical pump-driving ATPase GET3 [Myxococcota bacterium]|nr:arsenical pump-driving ATPase GET3 [Myxococcota bacterium]MBU1381068.1 arsenical pump-driving ATPase GET3 [Myxococcota bacterium]MBU1499121.1 arsenical pump-driving ATPase GET3 [Myxococcota bacterium]
MKNPGSFFISGKGGTGKSTISSILALYLSRKFRVMLISLDPAHSLSSIWKTLPASEPVFINSNLSIFEPDVSQLIAETVNKAKSDIRSRFRFLDSLNSAAIVNILSISPGIEEQALWEMVSNYTREFSGVIIFDAPPTGQAQKLLSVPIMMKNWSENLHHLAVEIRQMTERIWKGKSENQQKIEEITNKSLKTANYIYNLLLDTRFITVINDDPLSKMEAENYESYLSVMGFKTGISFVNMSENRSKTNGLGKLQSDLYGIEKLEEVLDGNLSVFEQTLESF